MLFMLLFVVFFFACQQPASEGTQSDAGTELEENEIDDDDDDYILTSEDTISRDTFNTWKSRWASLHTPYMDSTTIRYFDVPLLDLEDVLNEGADGSRFFMGLEQTGTGAYLPHLMIVGTNSGAPDYSLILDYSAACPPLCGN